MGGVAAFTRYGYDGVGVRDIAQIAGVTAMLINRYFGSKELLFAEAVDVAFAPRTVIAGTGVELAGTAAGVRAELMLSLQAGVWLIRSVLGTTALTQEQPEELAQWIESLFQVLVTRATAASPRPEPGARSGP